MWDLRRALSTFADGATLGCARCSSTFTPGGNPAERLRLVTVLDRLAATFGVDHVSAFIVSEHGYNAALVPDAQSTRSSSLRALMQDFELIELEGSSRTAWRASASDCSSARRRGGRVPQRRRSS